MKYLRKFETEGDVLMAIKPNVVMVGDTGDILYNVDSSGVYIQHIDGKLYTIEQWTDGGFPNEDANGVAVVDDKAIFVIAKTPTVNSSWTTWWPNSAVDGVMLTSDVEIAKTDYEGFKNTSVIVDKNVTGGAAYQCSNYLFPNGQKGYLPSIGEWMIVAKYKTEVKDALTLIGGTSIKQSWSSTQYSTTEAWVFTGSSANHRTKTSSGDAYTYIRAFTTLNP